MFDFLTSGLGMGSTALILVIVFLLYMKLMKWVFKVALFGILVLGIFWYFNPPSLG